MELNNSNIKENPAASASGKAKINLLPPGVAERIAAGEVIERPASVIKELVENSLDAGATEIAVILEDGGKNLIEILDNGHGMPPEDLALSIERHATSKLTTLEDLERISTLGFRGEALASVAAVSDLSMISRTEDSKNAYELLAGDVTQRRIQKPTPSPITFGYFLDSHHGTRIRAAGLFSQIPARLKFLKSQAAEVSQTREWLERLALAYPHVGFRLVSNDRTVLALRPETEISRVRAVLSDGDDYPIVTAEHEQDGFRDLGLKIRLHWVQGLSTSNSRKLVQVVNSRAVKDRILQQAVLAPFRQALLPGQYPAVALFIDINPAAIDVNVHPSKIEIRFLDNRKIFSSIDTLVKSMIARHGAPAIAAPTYRPFKSSSYKSANNFENNVTSSSNSNNGGTPSAPFPDEYSYTPAVPASGGRSAETVSLWKASEPETPQKQAFEESAPHSNSSATRSDIHSNTYSDTRSSTHSGIHSESPFTSAQLDPLEFSRYAGTLFNTYLLYEKKNDLILVDQHAAHERIRYENLRRKFLTKSLPLKSSPASPNPASLNDSENHAAGGDTSPVFHSQALLMPELVRVSTENRQLLVERLKQISYFGFDAELNGDPINGDNSDDSIVLFRAVPAEWGFNELKPRLRNLLDRLISLNEPASAGNEMEGSIVLDETLFELLASQACHSSVRAGDPLELEESSHLVDQLFKCEHPWNCPHGRPTVVYVPRAKLEEWFQRRV